MLSTNYNFTRHQMLNLMCFGLVHVDPHVQGTYMGWEAAQPCSRAPFCAVQAPQSHLGDCVHYVRIAVQRQFTFAHIYLAMYGHGRRHAPRLPRPKHQSQAPSYELYWAIASKLPNNRLNANVQIMMVVVGVHGLEALGQPFKGHSTSRGTADPMRHRRSLRDRPHGRAKGPWSA